MIVSTSSKVPTDDCFRGSINSWLSLTALIFGERSARWKPIF